MNIFVHRGRTQDVDGLRRERELLRLAQKAYISATMQGNGVMARHYAEKITKHKAEVARLDRIGAT